MTPPAYGNAPICWCRYQAISSSILDYRSMQALGGSRCGLVSIIAPTTRPYALNVQRGARERKIEMEDHKIGAALDRHWAASDANDFEGEHEIYREDAVLEYPQSGERIRGRHNIQASRVAQPNRKRFTIRRVVGAADLWFTEFVITYDARPSYTVSIMEFEDGRWSMRPNILAIRLSRGRPALSGSSGCAKTWPAQGNGRGPCRDQATDRRNAARGGS